MGQLRVKPRKFTQKHRACIQMFVTVTPPEKGLVVQMDGPKTQDSVPQAAPSAQITLLNSDGRAAVQFP